MAKKKEAKVKGKKGNGKVPNEAPLTPEELRALGYDAGTEVAGESRSWPKIRVDKRGLTVDLGKGTGEEPTDRVEAIIVHHHQHRQFYDTKYVPGQPTAPACYSIDGLVGSAFGNCGTCKFSFQGTMARWRAGQLLGENGAPIPMPGNAKKPPENVLYCKEKQSVYVVRLDAKDEPRKDAEGVAEGVLELSAPYMSLKGLGAYLKQVPHYAAVVTEITGKTVDNTFGQLQFRALRPAPVKLVRELAPTAQQLRLQAASRGAAQISERSESTVSDERF